MEHLIDIENISKEDILNIIETAKAFKKGSKESDVKGKTLALMFYENSTRTRCSFEIAAQKLGLPEDETKNLHNKLIEKFDMKM